MTETSSTKSSPESTASATKRKLSRQFLKKVWAILCTRITIRQFLKDMWETLRARITMAPKQIWQFLKRIIWGPENKESDKFWKKRAYPIIRVFGIFGTVALLGLVLPSLIRGIWSLRPGILENGGAQEKEIVIKEIIRDVYYLLIFVGAGLAASIATWRGRQAERQVREIKRQIQDSRLERQVTRFEKAIDMATDFTSDIRRGSGIRILSRMFFNREENFDALKEEYIAILVPIITQNFRLKGEKQLKGFKELYERSRKAYGEKASDDLFDETHVPTINIDALEVWGGLVKKNRAIFNNTPINGIFASKVVPGAVSRYIFSGMNLRDIHFLASDHEGQILSPNNGMYANFKKCCFLLTDMNGADVSYVNFTKSHFDRVNCVNEWEDCNMKCVGTFFKEANLIDCNFKGADFKDAFFIGTNISKSNFSRAKNLTPEQFLKGAYWIRRHSTVSLEALRPQFPNNFPPGFADTLPNERPTAEAVRGWEREWEIETGLSP